MPIVYVPFLAPVKGENRGSSEGVHRRVVSKRCLERPIGECDPLWRVPHDGHTLYFGQAAHPKDPPVLKIVRRANSQRGEKSLWQ